MLDTITIIISVIGAVVSAVASITTLISTRRKSIKDYLYEKEKKKNSLND